MGSLGFTWVYLGSLVLILVDLGDFGHRVENLEIQINIHRIPRILRDPIGSTNKIETAHLLKSDEEKEDSIRLSALIYCMSPQ